MNLKKKIESWSQKNTYTADWLYRHYHPGRELLLEKIIAEVTQIDSIVDVKPLQEYKKRILEDQVPFWSYDTNATESRMYGIHTSVFDGIEDRNFFFPSSEHGLILHNKNWSDTQKTARASCITLGEFRRQILRQYYDIPVFCVGPYIHYAEAYYTSDQMHRLKEELGRNLLVFPTHGTDDAEITYSEKSFLSAIADLRRQFDSVTVCAYWWNLDDRMIELFRKEGCRIVSAGFREDPNFLSRLRAIIDLSDFVIGDSVGTHIGYCLERDKPFCYFESDTAKKDLNPSDEEDQRFVQAQAEVIKKAFVGAREIGPVQLEVYRYYWGADQIKSREELRAMYMLNKKITIDCHGNLRKYGKYAQRLLHSCALPELQHRLLKESIA